MGNDEGHRMTDLEALTGDTLYRIAHRINCISRQWGQRDFPSDSGVFLRNWTLNFAESFFDILKGETSPERRDPWMTSSLRVFLTMGADEFTRCVGVASLCANCRKWQSRFSGLLDFEIEPWIPIFGHCIDWIYIAHDLTPQVAVSWFKAVTDNTDEGEDFEQSAKEVIGDYLAQTRLGESDAANATKWADWSLWADMTATSQNEDWVREHCQRIFDAL